MTFLIDGRLLTSVATAALTLYDIVSVATCALLCSLLAGRSKASLTRELVGVVLAVAGVAGS
jgi:hypothetical protein